MAKFSIDLNTGSLEKSQTVIGIDLGTTNSLIATIGDDQKPYCLGTDAETTVPSAIYLDKEDVIVGKAAIMKMIDEPANAIYSVKRLMGKSHEDIQSSLTYFNYEVIDEKDKLVKVRMGDKFYTPIELSSFVLKKLKAIAEKQLGKEVNKVVITVPAYFDDNQRQATRDAGKLAGMDVLRIINEPTAASLAYGLGKNDSNPVNIAVYDLGGGTFDISILTIQGGIYEVLSTNGNTFLGGDDFDNAISTYWKEQLLLKDLSASSNQLLRLEAEKAKKELSKNEKYLNEVEISGNTHSLKLNRSELNELIRPLIDSTIEASANALKDASMSVADIDEVILVGGSTKTTFVRERVAEYFTNSRINDSINPDEIVALGAAIEADILAGNRKDLLLLDVTPLSLGIETLGGLMDVIIPRNNKIPSTFRKEYTTSVDGQINLKITIYQGERELVTDNRLLGSFILSNIPAMPAGMPKVEVTFMLNADGILKVSAEELRSNVKQSVEMQSQYSISEKEIEKMLKDSITNASEDLEARSLAEAITEANQLIYSIERFQQKNKELITTDQTTKIQEFIDQINLNIKAKNKNDILATTESLNEYTKPFAEIVMNESMSKALKGRKI